MMYRIVIRLIDKFNQEWDEAFYPFMQQFSDAETKVDDYVRKLNSRNRHENPTKPVKVQSVLLHDFEASTQSNNQPKI